jgi:two-component system, cell cycle sensor histidine kinase and response regulator CckA
MWEFLSSDGFMPHGHCYLWKPGLVRLHFATDALIALAYVSIPFTLVRLVRRRRDVPFRWMFVWFGLFIVSCGATHLYEVWNLFHADYWAAGAVKAFTAFASVATAVLLARSMPDVLALPTPAALREANDALRRSQEDLERRVAERTAELSRLNTTLDESRVLLERSQAAAHVGSWASAADADGALVWSRETCRIFGIPEQEFDGKVATFLSLVHPEDRETVGRRAEAAFRGVAAYKLEHRILRRDGTVRWVLEQADVVTDPDTGAPMMIGIVQDVTERRLLEEQLQQAQKMEAVGRLAGGIAHDFNNLLGVIDGYAQLMLRSAEGEERHHLGEIQKAAERATALTRKLLAFSRRQVLQLSVFDINRVLEDMEKLLVRLIGEDVRLVTRLDPALGRVRADPRQIEQVLINMAVNARDAMPDGGQLKIETRNVVLDERYAAEHSSVTAGPYIMISVEDTGTGMDADTRRHIFEPFFTTKPPGKGTGLGLATAYGIVKQSQGHIWVYSEMGLGTIFKVYLPRVDQPAAADAAPAAPEPSRAGTETILLVEDEEALRNLTREILEAEGYVVLEAASGHAALEVARSFGGAIHLLLTDVVMPGMSGRALADALTEARPETRVLYMSGYTGDAIVHHGVLDEGLAFLQKPVSPDALLRKLRRMFDDGAPGA